MKIVSRIKGLSLVTNVVHVSINNALRTAYFLVRSRRTSLDDSTATLVCIILASLERSKAYIQLKASEGPM